MSTTVTQSDRLAWWLTSSQPDAVKAVLSLAYLRDGDDDANHDAACRVYGPHADTVIGLAENLRVIERLDCDSPTEVLSVFYDVDQSFTLNDADCVRDELKAGAIVTAQLVASLHLLPSRAAVSA